MGLVTQLIDEAEEILRQDEADSPLRLVVEKLLVAVRYLESDMNEHFNYLDSRLEEK